MTIIEIEGKRIEVGDGFKSMSPEEQERTVNDIASQLRIGAAPAPQSFMSNVNRGIADSVGGVVDFINPFDKPHSLNPFPDGTGSAKAGLQSTMAAGGIDVAQGEPDSLMNSFARGSGEAAGALPAVALGGAAAARVPGMVGNMAGDVMTSLASKRGLVAEMLAGGMSGFAHDAAKDAGAPEWVQNTAAIAAPMSIPAAGAAIKGVAKRTPVGGFARSAAKSVKAAAMPYTKSGAEVVASQRLVNLAGGPKRAEELRNMIKGDNPLGLTPAQQTDDPMMLSIEQLAARNDQALRARLEAREKAGRAAAVDEVSVPGDIDDTRAFFEENRRKFATELRKKASDAIKRAQAGVDAVGQPLRTEEENALAVSEQIRFALDDAKMQEAELWAAIPKGETVGTGVSRAFVADIVAKTPRAQQNDIPNILRTLLFDEGGFQDVETVSEMHGLYSELRRIARSAVAGNDKNNNLARIANGAADAILEDLGAVDGLTTVGRQINKARAFSAEMHATFDQGEVGRLLKKTLDGDLSVAPELSLQRTVARPGVAGSTAARDIEKAAPGSERYIGDFLKQQFRDAVSSPSGEFTSKNAQAFLRRNQPLLDRYPLLKGDIADAVKERDDAAAFAARIEARLGSLQKARLSAGAALLDGPPSQAIKAFTSAQNPVRAARLLASEAAKDKTGAALSGLKSLLSAELIKKPTGEGIEAALSDPKLKAAFRVIFSPEEISRMRTIGRELAKLDQSAVAAPSIGSSLSGASANKVLEYAARIVAARHGADLGGNGAASLQTAQMASSRMKEIMGRLTADRASQMLADAVEDPELFRSLLSDIRKPKDEARIVSSALPYLVGSISAADLNSESATQRLDALMAGAGEPDNTKSMLRSLIKGD